MREVLGKGFLVYSFYANDQNLDLALKLETWLVILSLTFANDYKVFLKQIE